MKIEQLWSDLLFVWFQPLFVSLEAWLAKKFEDKCMEVKSLQQDKLNSRSSADERQKSIVDC